MKTSWKISLALSLCAIVLPLRAIELPPVAYIGRITGWEGINATLTDPNATIEMRRVDNNCLLAQENLITVEGVRENYALQIPMTSDANPEYGQRNLAVYLKAFISGIAYTSPQLSLPASGSLVSYDLAFATDNNKNGVADEYEEEMENFYLPDAGITDPYDADADYDNDGMSNRDEYYAGTDPLNAKDKLAIINFTPNAANGKTAVEFIVSRGHSYAIKESENLSENFEETTFALTTEEGAPAYKRLNTTDATATATIYLLPTDATQQFIRVAVDIVPINTEENQ